MHVLRLHYIKILLGNRSAAEIMLEHISLELAPGNRGMTFSHFAKDPSSGR